MRQTIRVVEAGAHLPKTGKQRRERKRAEDRVHLSKAYFQ
jgi:hypothetical protein